jgi:hypothetical protein
VCFVFLLLLFSSPFFRSYCSNMIFSNFKLYQKLTTTRNNQPCTMWKSRTVTVRACHLTCEWPHVPWAVDSLSLQPTLCSVHSHHSCQLSWALQLMSTRYFSTHAQFTVTYSCLPFLSFKAQTLIESKTQLTFSHVPYVQVAFLHINWKWGMSKNLRKPNNSPMVKYHPGIT